MSRRPAWLEPRAGAGFGDHVRAAAASGQLVVQPRMGFSDPALMRAGLIATRDADAVTVGTVTLDSYTRNQEYERLQRALDDGNALNGYPLVTADPAVTSAVLDGVAGPDFPVQVRHGSPDPRDVVRALLAVGLSATEGGPVSYCLPYGRMPLRQAVAAWTEAVGRLAAAPGGRAHLETFGGCLMGQLCPPGLLVAVSVLEGLFFRRLGIDSISLSYAQQTHAGQDEEAIFALRRLAAELLPGADVHVVLYTYMGVYPRTSAGARLLGERAAALAVRAGAARLIVKTAAEASHIPTIADNVAALESAAAAAARTRALGRLAPADGDGEIYLEARALVEAVLGLDGDLGRALVLAFERGLLDVPYCLHPDNAGRARSFIDPTGRLRWSDPGRMPLRGVSEIAPARGMGAAELLESLTYVERMFDHEGSAALAGRKGLKS